jgi:hypothetical protein
MIPNRIYYAVKPFIPDSIRLALRRWWSRRQKASCSKTWPVYPGSEKTPDGWVGWPEGKKFAFILTHDVEGQEGLDRCEQLMELEKKAGFRSSFNLIPEGDYKVPASLRAKMEKEGFEVGLHDLEHDGKLFQSRADFRKKAVRINRYLQEWGAVGFRAGFMFHNLEWLTELNIEYDASTFDTDPFEPQPDGVNTIFPFWVSARDGKDPGRGYVELPYTLVQDSTLFLHLQEVNTDIWKKKLEWIAAHGGMVLLDTHPDYMAFAEGKESDPGYSARHYREFLEYVAKNYAGQYWSALPRDVARWYKACCQPKMVAGAK